MGYCTAYELKISDADDDTIEAIHKAILNNEDMSYVLRVSLGPTSFYPTNDSAKWYDHPEDMAALSRTFPGVLFHLHGAGEETGDLWNKYYRNGVEQVAKAQITFEECKI